MASNPHALYIAWGFPPSRGSGVPRALATANGLVRAGFDVTVVTCDRETFIRYTMADLDLEEQIDPAIDVVRVPFAWPLMDRDIRRWDRRRARSPREWWTWRPQEDMKEYPEVGYGPWRAPLVKEVEAIHRRRPVDLCLATANPNVDIEAAHQLFERHGVPFVMDQRDAWNLDTFAETEKGGSREHELEAAYLRDAHQAWFVNEPLRDWHAERHPEAAERIHAVYNGYDEGLAPRPRLEAPAESEPLTFGYLGTITPNTFLPQFLEGWVEARREDAELQAARADLWGYLGFYAGRHDASAALIDSYANAGVTYRGPVSKTQVAERYEDFDVLLLLLGTGRFVTSGKVFEYMASALPIVSIHSAELDVKRVLEGYPLWFPPASMDPDDVADALRQAARAAREAGTEVRQACADHARRYDRSAILGPRLRELREFAVARREASR